MSLQLIETNNINKVSKKKINYKFINQEDFDVQDYNDSNLYLIRNSKDESVLVFEGNKIDGNQFLSLVNRDLNRFSIVTLKDSYTESNLNAMDEFIWHFENFGLDNYNVNNIFDSSSPIIKSEYNFNLGISENNFIDINKINYNDKEEIVKFYKQRLDTINYIKNENLRSEVISPFYRSIDYDKIRIIPTSLISNNKNSKRIYYRELEKMFSKFYFKLDMDGYTYYRLPLMIEENGNIKYNRSLLIKNENSNHELMDKFNNMMKVKSLVPLVDLILTKYIIDRDENRKYYSHFVITQEGGKERNIYAPNEKIKTIFQEMNYILSNGYEKRLNDKDKETVYGFRPDVSIHDNAKYHANNKNIIKMDISKFFESIKFEYIEKYLRFIYSPNKDIKEINWMISSDLRDILINEETNGLYMGNPISPTLSNLMMLKFVRKINNTINRINIDNDLDIKFSIYADDITFSSNLEKYESGYFSKKFLTNLVQDSIYELGLYLLLNEKKTKYQSKEKRMVTGIRINHRNQITWTRKHYYEIRSALYKLNKSKKIEDTNFNLNELRGNLSFLYYSDESGKTKRLVNKYKDIIKEFELMPLKMKNFSERGMKNASHRS